MGRGMLLLGFWICVCMVFLVNAQEHTPRKLYCTDEDRAIFNRYCTQMGPKKSLPLDKLMIHTTLFSWGTPYVASTLEKEPEGLMVNLRELDCTIFVENVLALSCTLWGENPTLENFYENLQQLRYRGGTIHDYTNRLHYMTDWFYENERRGVMKGMEREIGDASLPLDSSFISTHPDSYKQLRNHPERAQRMADREKKINLRPRYYVPRQEIEKCPSGIKNDDILCFVTSIKGLDVVHVGVAYWKDGQLTFIHVSSSTKKVIVRASPLRDYAKGVKSRKRILVARPLSIY